MYALQTNDLCVDFGALRALNEVNLAVMAGERRGIIGPNGAGKTTLFNVICGYIRPSRGRVCVFERDVSNLQPHRRARLGLGRTFQRTNTFAQLTVEQNLALAIGDKSLGGGVFFSDESAVAARAADLLRRCNMLDTQHTVVKNLSYGQQRIVEILLALATEPRLLLLDEPSAGLSGAEVGVVTNFVKSLPRDITVVIIEHDMDLIFEVADNLTVMYDGMVLIEGGKDAIRQNERVREIYLGGGKKHHA